MQPHRQLHTIGGPDPYSTPTYYQYQSNEPLWWLYALDEVGHDADVDVYAEWEDDEPYAYNIWAIIGCKGKVYVVNTRGCSCPSPSETASVEGIFDSVAEAKDWLNSLSRDSPTYGWQYEAIVGLLKDAV